MSFKTIALKDSPGWLFDHVETSGTVMLDQSTNSNDGAYVGSPTLNQRSLTFLPHEGRSILFSGAKRATVPAGIVTTDTYTYEFLIRPETVSGVQCLAHDGTNGLYINNGKFSFYYSASYHDADTTLVTGQEYLLHVVVTAGTVEYFLDRVSDGTAASAPIFSATSLFAENGGGNELNVSACISACYPALALPSAKIRERYRAAFKVGYHKVIDNLGPSLHMTLSEDSGTTAFDISGNGIDGTVAGNPILATNAGPLHQSKLKAMTFDGVDDDIEFLTPAGCLADDASTFIGWIKPKLLQNDYIHSTRNNLGGVNNSQKGHYLQVKADGSLYMDFYGAAQTPSTAAGTIIANAWNLIAITKLVNAVDVKIYVGDALQSTTTVTGNVAEIAGGYTTFMSGTGSNNYEGDAAEFALLGNITLTAQQIKQIAAAGKSRFAAEILSHQPVNYFRQNAASGNAIDLGSLANDGVWTGSPTYEQASEVISNEASNKSIAVTTAESLAFTSHATTTTYSLLSIVKPTAVAGSQEIFTDGTDSLKLNGAKLGMFYSGTDHDANTTLVAGEAHLVGVSVDAGAATFNLDGISDGTAASATSFAPTKLYDLTFAGSGDEAAVFDFSLATAEYLDVFEMASYTALPFFGITGLITESLSATDFFVRALQLDTGTFIADAVMQGDQTYTIDFSQIAGYETYTDEVLLTCLARTGKKRINSNPYVVGDYYIPEDVAVNNHIYKVDSITTGISAASQPALDQAGGTTVDGGITVQDMGPMPNPQTKIDWAKEL